jgi:glycerol-3-phosphate acyltransferase PlsY
MAAPGASSFRPSESEEILLQLIWLALLGYVVGSVPFAYLIGKIFYNTDIRRHGSGNPGGSNAGRVLGKKAGLAVMTLDLLKVTAVVAVAYGHSAHPWAPAVAGLAAGLGHCFPVFLRIRGGKAVAALYGLLFALWVCGGVSAWVFFLPLLTFLLVLAVFKIVALSSMISAVTAGVYLWLAGGQKPVAAAVSAFALLIVVRHHGNIRRMLTGTENKIRWMG